MIRWAGAALLSATAAWLGLNAAIRLGKRSTDLRGMICGLSAMERAISDRGASLQEMLTDGAQVSGGPSGEFFRFCAHGVTRLEGKPFCTLWEISLKGAPLTLTPVDVQVIEALGSVLGRYDVDSQCRALRQALNRLERQLEGAEDEQERMGKVYGSLGVSAGLLLFLLFL